MVNKCSVFGCSTNYEGHEAGTVFGLKSVKDIVRKQQWFRFCNRSDLNPNSSIFIFEKHFEEKFMKRNDKQPRLINKLNPVPTIHPAGIYEDKPSCLPPTTSQVYVNLLSNEYFNKTNLARLNHLS